MKYKSLAWGYLLAAIWINTSSAISPADYADRFKVDVNAEIPPLEELRGKFAKKPVYDRKFDYFWNIGTVFDKPFSQTIQQYGTRQSRLKWSGEDAMLEQIKNMPKEYYPYIGPYLHTIPGISEKVLNYPGIKETKNQFPSRIAPQLSDVKDLEFLSPALYFILMPEAWGGNDSDIDRVKLKTLMPSNNYNTKFISKIMEVLPPKDFAPGAKPKDSLKNNLRTISPDATSPLTSKDIQAVARSIADLAEFSANINNKAKVIEAGIMLDAWENANGNGGILPNIKDLVHPCQRLVQKIKMQGMENEFREIIANEGFNSEEWAYTCDKTIKAYRLLNMTQLELKAVMLYKNNIFENQLEAYSDVVSPSIAITMQSVIEMYKAPLEDMLEVKKNRDAIKNALEKVEYRIVTQPIHIR